MGTVGTTSVTDTRGDTFTDEPFWRHGTSDLYPAFAPDHHDLGAPQGQSAFRQLRPSQGIVH